MRAIGIPIKQFQLQLGLDGLIRQMLNITFSRQTTVAYEWEKSNSLANSTHRYFLFQTSIEMPVHVKRYNLYLRLDVNKEVKLRIHILIGLVG